MASTHTELRGHWALRYRALRGVCLPPPPRHQGRTHLGEKRKQEDKSLVHTRAKVRCLSSRSLLWCRCISVREVAHLSGIIVACTSSSSLQRCARSARRGVRLRAVSAVRLCASLSPVRVCVRVMLSNIVTRRRPTRGVDAQCRGGLFRDASRWWWRNAVYPPPHPLTTTSLREGGGERSRKGCRGRRAVPRPRGEGEKGERKTGCKSRELGQSRKTLPPPHSPSLPFSSRAAPPLAHTKANALSPLTASHGWRSSASLCPCGSSGCPRRASRQPSGLHCA